MASRIQVDSGLRPERLRPAAAPVDTFAPSSAGLELAQLAGALKDFGASAGRYAAMAQEKEAKDQSELGAQKARELEEQRITYRDAVKQGLIKPSDNPWFLVGAKQQFGRAAAGQYARALQAAIETDPAMQASTEPADYDKFEQGFRKQWLEENVGKNRDQLFEKGFEIVDGYAMDEGRRFIAAAGARLEKRAGESLGIIVGQVLDQHYKEGPEVASSLINAEIKSYLADNPKAGRIANLRSIDAVADWARLNYKTVGKEDVEKLLRSIDAGPGSKLFGTHEAKQMLNDVEKEVISMRGASMNLAHAEEAHAVKVAEDSFWTDVGSTLGKTNQGALTGLDLSPLITRLNAIDPGADNAAKLQNFRESLLSARGNDTSMRNALSWVEGVNPDRPGQFLTQKQLVSYVQAEGLSAGQYNTVVNAIQERDRLAAEGKANSGSKLLGDRMYAAGEQYIRGKMLDPWGTNTTLARSAAEEAVRDFGIDFLAHYKDIQDIKDPARQSEYINSLAERSFILHAPPEIQKESGKASEIEAGNVKAKTIYEQVSKNVAPADFAGVNQAIREFKQGIKSEAAGRLLQRLGVPIDDEKQVRLFFLEWERNH